MRKRNYTLIELLAAMAIFIIMMGILFKTFTAAADVASAQTVKVNILSDANVFLNYFTNDIKNIDILAIEKILDKDNGEIDPNTNTTSNEATGNKLHFNSTSISFYSNVVPYDDRSSSSYSYDTLGSEDLITGLDGDADGFADLNPYMAYELVTYTENGVSKKALVRKMYAFQSLYVDDTGAYVGTTSSGDMTTVSKAVPVILEGVESFTVKVWDDYPGGSEITTSPIGIIPACITVTVVMTDPNPFMAAAIKDRNKRQITKVIYLNR